MTKQEILDRLCDIDFVFYDSATHETLSRMIDELLKERPEIVRCKDCRHGEIDTEHFVRPVIVCNNPLNGVAHASHRFDWFCADGVKK